MYKTQKKILLSGSKKSYSWIFAGPKNSDKLKIAQNFAAWLLSGDALLTDLLLIQRDKIKIEDTQQIHKFITLTPSVCKKKVIIIDNFENITINAANSLLKLLEESKQDSMIILITDALNKILPTIRSRCFILNFPPKAQNENQHTAEFIQNYEKILKAISSNILLDNIPEKEVFCELVLFTFARIIKFCHSLNLQEIFSGEFIILNSININKTFWHYKYKQTANLIRSCRENNLDHNYIKNILL